MTKHTLADESGIALPLAIMTMVLIGVMGAGLLVFAQTDLSSMVETNQGQKAFNLADSGAQIAGRQLRRDARPESYGNGAVSDNVDWSYKKTGGSAKNYNEMKDFEYGGNHIKVSIQYLPPVTEPDSPTQDQAPEVIPFGQTRLLSGCKYFKVRSFGEVGQARRGVEAIYCASKLSVPTAYFTPKNIEFSGSVDVSGVSFFAIGNIYISESIRSNIDRSTPAIYSDWNTLHYQPPSNHNTVSRINALGQPVVGAGLAAEGLICNQESQCSSVSDSVADGYNDYDKSTGVKGQTKKFCGKPGASGSTLPCSASATTTDQNPSGTISYPFTPSADPDLEFLKEEAQQQGNYYVTNKAIATSVGLTKAKYPCRSTDQTVFYMKGEGGDVSYDIPADYGTGCTEARGTIIVENGNINMNGSVKFKGIIIITGDGVNTGQYKTTGTPELEGFVIADGKMTIRGDAVPLAVNQDYTNRPGFYGVSQWSWRECYNKTCGVV